MSYSKHAQEFAVSKSEYDAQFKALRDREAKIREIIERRQAALFKVREQLSSAYRKSFNLVAFKDQVLRPMMDEVINLFPGLTYVIEGHFSVGNRYTIMLNEEVGREERPKFGLIFEIDWRTQTLHWVDESLSVGHLDPKNPNHVKKGDAAVNALSPTVTPQELAVLFRAHPIQFEMAEA